MRGIAAQWQTKITCPFAGKSDAAMMMNQPMTWATVIAGTIPVPVHVCMISVSIQHHDAVVPARTMRCSRRFNAAKGKADSQP
jgi:hypothetical protein